MDRVSPVRFLPRRAARLLGGSLLGGGVLLGSWFEHTLRRARTPANPYKPVAKLVEDGPFRYSRNPGYISFTMTYAGIASLANAFWAILLLPVAVRLIRQGVIEREERYLEARFGEEYRRYKERVPRWL